MCIRDRPTIVNKPNPKLSNRNKVTRNFFSTDLKIIEIKQVTKMREKMIISCIQKTGTSNKTSLTVPPPTAVTKAIIRTPNGSRRFCIAAKLPDMAKETAVSYTHLDVYKRQGFRK